MKSISTATINDFIACMFDGKYFTLGPTATAQHWDELYLDYIDLSGQSATPEYDLIVTIYNAENRTRIVPVLTAVVDECIRQLGRVPPNPVTALRKFGYRIPDDPIAAIEYLPKIEQGEKRIGHELRAARNSLEKLRREQTSTSTNPKKERRKFIQMLNGLGTIYRIDRERTTVEELALMVREQAEQRREEQINKAISGRK